jgi:hypothetical protein
MSLVTWNGKLLLSPNGRLTLGPAADICCCVEEPPVDCTSPDAVRQGDWQIVVAGVDGDGCDGSAEGQRCPDVNGTYVFTGPPDVTTKEYTAPASKNICGLYGWRLRNGYDASGEPSADYCDYLLDHGGLDNVTYYGNGLPNETITLSLVTSADELCQNWPATIDLVPV